MTIRKIGNILRKAIGLKPSSIGETLIKRAVHYRMRQLNVACEYEYLKQLAYSAEELQELIEEVVVHETWFFRDSEPFNALVDFAANTWNSLRYTSVPARILSVSCSTGEEPYSIVIALLQAGWTRHQFSVDAVDISRKAIAKAKQALYKEKSFRTANLSFRRIYFHQKGDKYQLLPLVADCVRFFHGNIVNPAFFERLGIYDVIFCRNILIYLDHRHQRQIVNTLHRLLTSDGLLITGHSETALFPCEKFCPVPQGGSFAFFKAASEKKMSRHTRQTITPKTSDRSFYQSKSPVHSGASVEQLKESISQEHDDSLSLAKKEADAGNLGKAEALCEKYLQKHGPSAEGYFLLGLIQEGLEKSAAAYDLFRKALYLAPDHVDSLIHLGYLADKVGNQQGAANYRRRAAKLMKKE